MKLIFVTGNKNKFEEAKKILADVEGLELYNHGIDLDELQGSAEEIVKKKAMSAYNILGEPCFVEDTSLSFTAWNGLPGPYIKDFVMNVGIEKIPSLLKGMDTSAVGVSSIGYADGTDIYCFVGKVHGKIVPAGGETRFDWDRIFMPDGHTKRFSEMTIEEKNEISHRRKAFEAFRDYLKK